MRPMTMTIPHSFPEASSSTMLHPLDALPPGCSADDMFEAILEDHLMAFTRFCFHVVRPGVPFKPNWHLEAMTDKLAKVDAGEIRRLIINVPPRNLKSLCA